MSTVATIGKAAPQLSAASTGSTDAGSAAQAVNPPLATGSDTAPPTDVVSLSSVATTSATQARLPTMDPTQVDDALSGVAGANGFAFLAAHFDYAEALKHFGKATADRGLGAIRAAAESAPHALSHAENLGIPVQTSPNPDTSKNNAVPGNLTVSAFSFTSGGSTYAITPGANGMLVGTKDGQAWRTWQIIDPDLPGNPAITASATTGASAALQVLSLITQGAGQSSRPLDLSA